MPEDKKVVKTKTITVETVETEYDDGSIKVVVTTLVGPGCEKCKDD